MASVELKKLNAEIVDEHYYANPEWFLKNATRYDKYDRNSYKIFAGEYAAQSKATCSPDNQNNWKCALSEAAFMTGLERNADVVNLCSYAPLFAHVDGWQWKPDLIWFDNLHSFGTDNYYVQKLYSNNKGTQVLPMLQGNKPLTGQDGLYASAAFDQKSNEIILKLVNTTSKAQTTSIVLDGAKKLDPMRLGGGLGIERQREEVRLRGEWTIHNFLGGLRTLRLRVKPAYVVIPSITDISRRGLAADTDHRFPDAATMPSVPAPISSSVFKEAVILWSRGTMLTGGASRRSKKLFFAR